MGRLGLLGELRLVQFSQGRRATRYSVGPCRREERTRLEHVPDGLGELASHLDATAIKRPEAEMVGPLTRQLDLPKSGAAA